MEIVHTTCVKLGKSMKSVRQLLRRFYIHTFVSSHTLITIAQSISCIFLLTFAPISRKLLHTFVFNKLTSYDVTIPGMIQEYDGRRLHTSLIYTQILNFIDVTEQCFFNGLAVSQNKIGLLWYTFDFTSTSMCISSP